MRVVVTGGAGFIGTNLVRGLLGVDEVDEVVVVDDLSTGDRANLDGLDVEFHEGSILDADLLDTALAGAKAVVHLAARPSVPRSIEDPVASHEVNASGTMQVLEAVRRNGAPHLVVASSSSVYGANPTLPKHEELAVAPLSPYAASKLATETYTLAHAASYGLDALVFRFFNVYGPYQPAGHAYAAAIPAFVDAALRDEPLPVHGDGGQTRDFTFVGSVARVITSAILQHITSERPVNLAFGSRRTLLEVIDELRELLDRPVEVAHQPTRPGDVRHSQADGSRLEGLFPDVDPVPFGEGLARTVDWLRSELRR